MSDFNICEFKVLSNDKLLYHNLFYNIFLNNINTNNISENQRHLTVDKTQYYLLVLLTASFFFPKFIICHLTDIFCHHSIEILDFEINKFMFHYYVLFISSLGFLFQMLDRRYIPLLHILL